MLYITVSSNKIIKVMIKGEYRKKKGIKGCSCEKSSVALHFLRSVSNERALRLHKISKSRLKSERKSAYTRRTLYPNPPFCLSWASLLHLSHISSKCQTRIRTRHLNTIPMLLLLYLSKVSSLIDPIAQLVVSLIPHKKISSKTCFHMTRLDVDESSSFIS